MSGYKDYIDYVYKLDIDDKWDLIKDKKEEINNKLNNLKITPSIVNLCLRRINNEKRSEHYIKIGKMLLDFIYNSNPISLISNINIKQNNSKIIKNNSGNINLYGEKYLKIDKTDTPS